MALSSLTIAIVVMLGACPESITDSGHVLTVAPSSASLFVDDTTHFTGRLVDGAGEPVPDRLVWSSDDPDVAQVDSTGRAWGIGPGTTTLRVTARGKVATASVVVAEDAGRLTVSPQGVSLFVDGTQRLIATFTDRHGDTLAVTTEWKSEDAAVASVDVSGLVTGIATGSTTIEAKARGLVATASITVTPRPQGAVLVGAGDVASCSSSGDEATARLLDDIPGTIFVAGDIAYDNGSSEDFSNCYEPSWGRHRERTRPVPGNHEYFTPDAAGYFDYFGTAAAGDRDKGYYSYELGGWHIIALNSSLRTEPGSPQEVWLRDDLAKTRVRCVLAYFHHPRFSSGVDHGNDLRMQPLWDALYEYSAEIVISAHDHIYERFAPQSPTGTLDLARGIRQFIVGTGGGNRDTPGTPRPNSEVRSGSSWGVLKLSLFSDRYEWQFVPVAGRTFTDSGSGSCR